MKSRRTAKVAQAILQSISSTILFGLKDPRVRNVTILSVDVSPDIRTAKVYVSIMGDEKTQALCMHGLNSARGFLQAKCADRIQTRYTPVLKFILDESVKKSAEASQILDEVLPSSDGNKTDEDVQRRAEVVEQNGDCVDAESGGSGNDEVPAADHAVEPN
jgi:ribosome-binding factor A